ncbi:hypothetical protein ABZ330_29870 [Streptomyces sp. NPDC006172]|uniref:hypothetical protein n=1 Tax=Streptomyces sp. NPDC006172 TaxID=3154470 RepID=UPI0033D3860C
MFGEADPLNQCLFVGRVEETLSEIPKLVLGSQGQPAPGPPPCQQVVQVLPLSLLPHVPAGLGRGRADRVDIPRAGAQVDTAVPDLGVDDGSARDLDRLPPGIGDDLDDPGVGVGDEDGHGAGAVDVSEQQAAFLGPSHAKAGPVHGLGDRADGVEAEVRYRAGVERGGVGAGGVGQAPGADGRTDLLGQSGP